jgi:hypothetical protein
MGNAPVRPKADPATQAAFLAPRLFSDQCLSALKTVRSTEDDANDQQPIRFDDGAAYERMMGAWSRLVGHVSDKGDLG